MTVAELIGLLERMPQEAGVWQHIPADDYHCFEGGIFEVTGEEFEFNPKENRLEIWT